LPEVSWDPALCSPSGHSHKIFSLYPKPEGESLLNNWPLAISTDPTMREATTVALL